MSSKTIATKPQTSATLKLVEGAGNITKRLATLKTTMASAQAETHLLACSVLAHVGKHKDVRLVTTLLESVGDMVRTNAIRAWFEAHGPVAFDDKGAIRYAGERPTQIAKAMGTPFWKFKPEAAYVPMEIGKSFDRWVKALEKDAKETGRDHTALIAGLVNLRPDAEPTTVAPATAPADAPAAEQKQAA
ncbi:hypothetical protein [Bradyrhizobium sp. DASA03007]|uniref:hypothetical protein n=1 Tax=unclassified Bradyrhizobium TaxID=2631580 RepID=UPI003F6F3D50